MFTDPRVNFTDRRPPSFGVTPPPADERYPSINFIDGQPHVQQRDDYDGRQGRPPVLNPPDTTAPYGPAQHTFSTPRPPPSPETYHSGPPAGRPRQDAYFPPIGFAQKQSWGTHPDHPAAAAVDFQRPRLNASTLGNPSYSSWSENSSSSSWSRPSSEGQPVRPGVNQPYGLVPTNLPPVYGMDLGRSEDVVRQVSTPPKPKPPTQTQNHYWAPPPPTVAPQLGLRASKKAIIIGCNYRGTSYELKGCIHDARNIEYLLITKFGFAKENIRVLVDDGSGQELPTRANIFKAIRWLTSDLQSGDSLFFHFSGHGSQKEDLTGDERDGMNETLLPSDFRLNGQIVDDEINERLINPLPRGVCLHAIIDACHSGTAMDLEYYTKIRNGRIEWRSEGPTKKYKGTCGGVAILFSACADSQLAQDTDTLSGSVHTGAATHAFIEVVERRGKHISYGEILSHMHVTMEKLAGKSGEPPQGMAGKVLDRLGNAILNFMGVPQQTPQISCNTDLNLNDRLRI